MESGFAIRLKNVNILPHFSTFTLHIDTLIQGFSAYICNVGTYVYILSTNYYPFLHYGRFLGTISHTNEQGTKCKFVFLIFGRRDRD